MPFAGSITAHAYGFVCHLQAAKFLWVGLLEGQVLEAPPIDPREVAFETLGIREGKLYGHTHVGHSELSLHGSVLELHCAVQDALWMHDDLYSLGRDVEEPTGLDDLEAFVHHRCAVDSDFRAHVPVGMLQGLCRRDVAKLVERKGAERTAACREDELLYGTRFAHEALEDSTVFAIDGQQRHLVLQTEARDEFTGHDKCLLVCKGDGLACLDGTDGGAQTTEAHESSQHDVNRLHLYHLAEGIGSSIDLYRLAFQSLAHIVVLALVGNDDALRLVLLCLLNEQVGIGTCRQHVCIEQVRMLGDDLQRLRADAASRT